VPSLTGRLIGSILVGAGALALRRRIDHHAL
jgi:hypothetical protein